MKQLIIDRKTWLRGEGSDNSKLLRVEDGKKCCLGSFATQLAGLTEDQIAGVATPDGIAIGNWGKLLEIGTRTVCGKSEPSPRPSPVCISLMSQNDRQDDPDKEQKLTELFASIGVAVTFIN